MIKKCFICNKDINVMNRNQKYCSECSKIRRYNQKKENKKRYKKLHPDRVKQQLKNYYQKNKLILAKKGKEYYKKKREYYINYHKRPEIRKKSNDKKRQDYHKNPNKFHSRNKAWYYIKIPLNQLCELCNKELATARHHEDYNKPLEVKFLCHSCHELIHSKYKNLVLSENEVFQKNSLIS